MNKKISKISKCEACNWNHDCNKEHPQFDVMHIKPPHICQANSEKPKIANPSEIPNSSKSHLNNCCTGIKDENGQFICKGDIVEINYFRKGGGALPDQYQGQVAFRNGGFYVGDISFSEIIENNILAQKGQKLPINFKIIGISENREDNPTHQPIPPLDWEKEFHQVFSKGLEDGIGKVRWSRTLEVKDFIKKLLAVQEAKTREEERKKIEEYEMLCKHNYSQEDGYCHSCFSKKLEIGNLLKYLAQQQILDLNNKKDEN